MIRGVCLSRACSALSGQIAMTNGMRFMMVFVVAIHLKMGVILNLLTFKNRDSEIRCFLQLRNFLRTQMWITVWIHGCKPRFMFCTDECATSCTPLRKKLRTFLMFPTLYFILIIKLVL